jgi:hypothetical protein
LRVEVAALVQPTEADAATAPLPLDSQGAAAVEAVLRQDADAWTVAFGAHSFRLKDTKGLRFLHMLLQQPGREFHVVDLSRGEEGAEEGAGRAGSGPLLDPAARAAYKRRLEDLRDTLEEARGFNDLERAARAEQEIDFLSNELARAVGLGGRSRAAASAAERARINVTRTIGAVVKKIAAGSPALGQHLAATVRTGFYCSYSPDPRVVVTWRF